MTDKAGKATFTIIDKSGKPAELALGLEAYEAAGENKRDLRQEVKFIAANQGVQWDANRGDLLDQLYRSSGLLDSEAGGTAMTLADMRGASAGFRAPDGQDTSLAARLLYPQQILDTFRENALDKDGSDLISKWQGLVAITNNLNGERAEQPIINTKGPEESESQRITQLAEPVTMVSITTSQTAYNVPTYSIGLTISEQAMKTTTIDLVRTVMSAQARGQRLRNIEANLKALVLGDKDLGIEALPVHKVSEFDADGITGNGQITKKAFIKWLHHARYHANLTRVLTGIDEALLVDDQLAPKHTGTDNSKIATPFGGINLGIPTPEFIPFDQDVFGAGILVALDPNYAIQRFVNVSASFEGIQEYVMRRATSFRVDYGEMATRLHDAAWSVLSLEK